MKKRNKGITLIGLVITIVIMLILTGIAINLLFGDNGLITKTKLAKKAFLGEDAKQVVEDRVNAYIAEKGPNGELDLYDFWYMYNGDSNLETYDEDFIIYLFEEDAAVNFPRIQVYTRGTRYTSAVVIYKGYQMTVNNNFTVAKEVKAIVDLTEEDVHKFENENENEKIKSRYVVVEVFDHIGGNCAAINEIEVYDASNNKKEYTISNIYEQAYTYSYINLENLWSKDNLYDGETSYTTNVQGGENSTIFNFGTSPNSENYARMILDLGEVIDIRYININHGGAENRTPGKLSVYIPNVEITSADYSKICQKQMESSLQLIETKQFTKVELEPKDYIFSLEDLLGPAETTVLSRTVDENDINLTVGATDTGSGIKKVEFYHKIKDGEYVGPTNGTITNGEAVGSKNEVVFAAIINNLEDEVYYIYAKLYDIKGNITETPMIRVGIGVYGIPEADIYVSTAGNDSTGNGTLESPYATVSKAITSAVSGKSIYIGPGEYDLTTLNSQGFGYTSAGICDLSKGLEIFGDNENTILKYDGAGSARRDAHAVHFENENSILRNLVYEYTPGKTENYSNAIISHSEGKIENVFFRVRGDRLASYIYANGVHVLNIENCTYYHDKGSASGDYSGNPSYSNILTNVTLGQGTPTNTVLNNFGLATDTTQVLIQKSKALNSTAGVFVGDNRWD